MKFITGFLFIWVSAIFCSSRIPHRSSRRSKHAILRDSEYTKVEAVEPTDCTFAVTKSNGMNGTYLSDTGVHLNDISNGLKSQIQDWSHFSMRADLSLDEPVLGASDLSIHLNNTNIPTESSSKKSTCDTAQQPIASDFRLIPPHKSEEVMTQTITDKHLSEPSSQSSSSTSSGMTLQRDEPSSHSEEQSETTLFPDMDVDDAYGDDDLSKYGPEPPSFCTDTSITRSIFEDGYQRYRKRYGMDEDFSDGVDIGRVPSSSEILSVLPYELDRDETIKFEEVPQRVLATVIGVPIIVFHPIHTPTTTHESMSVDPTKIISDNDSVAPPPEYVLIQHAIQLIRFMKNKSVRPFADPVYIISTWRGARSVVVEIFMQTQKRIELMEAMKRTTTQTNNDMTSTPQQDQGEHSHPEHVQVSLNESTSMNMTTSTSAPSSEASSTSFIPTTPEITFKQPIPKDITISKLNSGLNEGEKHYLASQNGTESESPKCIPPPASSQKESPTRTKNRQKIPKDNGSKKKKGKKSPTASQKTVSHKRKSPATTTTKKQQNTRQPKQQKLSPPVIPLPQENYSRNDPKSTKPEPQTYDQYIAKNALNLLMAHSRIELLRLCGDQDLPWPITDSPFLYALAQIHELIEETDRGVPLLSAQLVNFVLKSHTRMAVMEFRRINDYWERLAKYQLELDLYNKATGNTLTDTDASAKRPYALLVDINSIPPMI